MSKIITNEEQSGRKTEMKMVESDVNISQQTTQPTYDD